MNPLSVRQSLQQWLLEDMGHQDFTTELLIPAGLRLQGRLTARAAGRVAGLQVARETFMLLDPSLEFYGRTEDGRDVGAGEVLADLRGEARAILSAERLALNLLQRMSGIATATRDVCRRVAHTKARVADTRKTAPGLRLFDKFAVSAGGGSNHRFGLYDAVLIKDNHIQAAGSLGTAVDRIRSRAGHWIHLEVEADTLEQVAEAADLGVHAILFDNMSARQVGEAVKLVAGRAVTDASGGIRPENVAAYAETGVDVLSLGWLTHSAAALDIGLDLG